MVKKHVQAELAPHEYAAFLRLAEAHHLSVKEGAREAILTWVRQNGWKDDSIFNLIGVAKSRKGRDASRNVDEIYDQD